MTKTDKLRTRKKRIRGRIKTWQQINDSRVTATRLLNRKMTCKTYKWRQMLTSIKVHDFESRTHDINVEKVLQQMLHKIFTTKCMLLNSNYCSYLFNPLLCSTSGSSCSLLFHLTCLDTQACLQALHTVASCWGSTNCSSCTCFLFNLLSTQVSAPAECMLHALLAFELLCCLLFLLNLVFYQLAPTWMTCRLRQGDSMILIRWLLHKLTRTWPLFAYRTSRWCL